MMTNDQIARLLREYRPGERVRATLNIVYVNVDVEVAEGTLGTVKNVEGVRGAALVQWDTGVCQPTMCDLIEPSGEVVA